MERTILSIDGGGVRGVIPLACLVKLEQETGRPCREQFAMIAGTSTGAVIAAGLALGISARGLLAFYRNLARLAFDRLSWWQVLLNLGNHRYRSEFLAATLDELGARRSLNSLPLDILITATNTESGVTDFFVRDGPGNASKWGTMMLRDAVLASIAAPTYFPAHTATVQGQTYTWTDGGVGVHGNPCYVAALEALSYSADKYPRGETRLLAFGTGRTPNRIDAPQAHLLEWVQWSLTEVLQDSAEWQSYVTHERFGRSGELDFRRYQLEMSNDVMDQLGVEVPSGVDVAQIHLDDVWAMELLERIGRAFAERIDFNDPDGLVLASRPEGDARAGEAPPPGSYPSQIRLRLPVDSPGSPQFERAPHH